MTMPVNNSKIPREHQEWAKNRLSDAKQIVVLYKLEHVKPF